MPVAARHTPADETRTSGAPGRPPKSQAPTLRRLMDGVRAAWTRRPNWILKRTTPMWPLWQIVVSVVGAWLALQAGIIAILAVVAQQRKRRQLLHKFPHYDPPQTRLGDNQLKIYSYGQYLYTDMLAAIDAAQERIYIESFIWKDDAIGLAFKEHLAAKAQAGVQVYVIFDVFGNLVVPRAFK
ncbi:MAG TPA: hypothetical protein VKQ36_14590, partial [Ktedonobacterales bacterium]|nr:hypothetical protein [Ktedonobacterales bacterium]